MSSEERRKSTLKQIRELIFTETLKKVKGYQTIWHKCGEGGKAHWATYYKAEALFDDQPPFAKRPGIGAVCRFPLLGTSHTKAAPFGPLLKLQSLT